MKTLYTLLIAAFMMVSNAHAAAELFLKVNKGGRYTVTIDDNTVSNRSNIYRFFDLSSGTYTLRVTQNNFFNTVVYERPVNLPEGYRTVAELDKNWNLQIIQQLPYQAQAWYLDQVYSNGNGYPSYPGTTQPYPYPYPGHGNGGWNPGNGYPYPTYPPVGAYPIGNIADNSTIQSLKSTMKNLAFDDKMLQVAKTSLKKMNVTTAQVSDLMSVLSFDSNKLELAKFAYDRTLDKQNYFQLYDDFSFGSNATELDKYIASR